MEGAFCVCSVHGIVHEASEEGRRGGSAVRRTRGRRSRRRRRTTSTQAPRPFICDELQMKCNSPTMDHERADPGFRDPAGGSPGAG